MQLVTDPAQGVARGVVLGSDRAMLRQVGEHLGEAHGGLTLDPTRLLLLNHLALFGPAALALRWRRRRTLLGLFARLDRGRIARQVADQAVLIAALDQRLVQAARQGAARKLGKSARERCFAWKRA